MNGSKQAAYAAKTRAAIFSPRGQKAMRDALVCDLPPEAALICVARRVTRIETIERLAEIALPMLDDPKVRGQLRRVGYSVKIRSEVEFSYMEATV
ncbi:MAG: hypothetical protein WC854_14270 [Bacteroidales bacterium]